FASHTPSKYLSLSASSTNSSISVVASNSAKLAPNEVFKFTTSGALSALTSDSTFCSRSSAGTSNQSMVTLRSEEHTSELQSRFDLVCRLLLEKKKTQLQNQIQLQFH